MVPESAEKIIVKRSELLYFKEPGWTTVLEEATVYLDMKQVFDACQKHHLDNVDLLLRMDSDPRFNVRLPIEY